jgi:hypothetical protein
MSEAETRWAHRAPKPPDVPFRLMVAHEPLLAERLHASISVQLLLLTCETELLNSVHDHEQPFVVTRIVSEQKPRAFRVSCSPTLPE